MKRKYYFEDAIEMHKRYPDTFALPDLTRVKVGRYVKVCFHDERFWVLVTDMDDSVITGSVANQLVVAPLKYEDKIWFEYRHVYDVDNGELGSIDSPEEPMTNLQGVHDKCN